MNRADFDAQVVEVSGALAALLPRLTKGGLEGNASASFHDELSTQNWSGQGESDSLIKTKHCDGLKR